MFEQRRYPKINIWDKLALAKRISDKNFPEAEALQLINNVLKDFDKYWYDSKSSEPEKGKYVRSAHKTPLGTLLGRIDKMILAPQDRLVPDFFFGGISRRNHVQAAKNIQNGRNDAVLLSLDVKGFFEQILENRVFYFFYKKCGCSAEIARLLARVCCVSRGPKGSVAEKTLARGFATSTRLALWCNLDTFLRLQWFIKRRLKGHNPKISIFVDDIGISADTTSLSFMKEVSNEAQKLLLEFDRNQPLPMNPKKEKIQPLKGAEHLGVKYGRTKLGLGSKSRSKRDKVLDTLKVTRSKAEKKKLLQKIKGYSRYQRQLKG